MLEQWISATAWPMTPPSGLRVVSSAVFMLWSWHQRRTCVSSSQVQRRLLPPNFTRCRTVFDRL